MDLLSFPSFQCLDGAGDQGVPLGLVLDTCAILTHNRPGQLRLLDPPDTVFVDATADPDLFIHKGYYISTSCTTRTGPATTTILSAPPSATGYYPPMTPSEASFAVKMDDNFHCIVTGSFGCLDSSHLVPSVEADWFRGNLAAIQHLGGSARDLDSVYNEVSLRADLSKPGLDSGLFVFAPYAGEMLTIFTDATAAPTLAYEHHLRPINVPTRIRWVYWYSRFAYNIFMLAKDRLAFLGRAMEEAKERHHGQHLYADDPGPLKHPRIAGPEGSGNPHDGGGGGSGRDNGRRHSGRTQPREAAGRIRARRARRPEPPPYSLEYRQRLLALAKATDTKLTDKLTVNDVQCGRYPGYSAMKQLAFDWFVENPQISAVRGADERSVADGDSDMRAERVRGLLRSVRRCLSPRARSHGHPRRRPLPPSHPSLVPYWLSPQRICGITMSLGSVLSVCWAGAARR
ncbi:hypothetical protein C8J57DRAFT_1729519 [Mycena rebaudengoi]|nr:hypothetical protein C8J57DRAFT_1729519 [Mycena rebaudengoi]